MKILLISRIPSYFERFPHPGKPFPEFQVQTYWLKALRQLSHQVKVFRYSDNPLLNSQIFALIDRQFYHYFPFIYQKYKLFQNRFYYLFPNNWLRSLKLSGLIKSFKPRAIIISGGISELTGLGLTYARRQDIPIYLLHGEDPLISATQFSKDYLNLFTWIIVNDPTHANNWRQLGAQKVLALPYSAIDPQIHRRLKLSAPEKRIYSSEIVFVGTLFKDRQQILKQLIYLPIKIYGYIPPEVGLDPILKPFYWGEAWGKKVVKIYNSTKIALNFVPPHMPVGGNLRTFEIAGCGAFQLASRCPKAWYLPGKEIVLFNSVSDLKRKINFYLNHPPKRIKISSTAYKKTHQQYTYQHRFTQILNLS